MAALAHTALPLGMSMRFRVIVDAVQDLGSWQTCKGLAVQFTLEEIKEGGTNDHIVYLPGRLKYPKIKLARAVNSNDSRKVQTWLSKCADDMKPSETAVIALHDSHGHVVTSWTLRNVYPSAWTGPDLDATSSKVALETLELAHEGFL